MWSVLSNNKTDSLYRIWTRRTTDLWLCGNKIIWKPTTSGWKREPSWMYSMWVFSSEISSNDAIKHSQRQQRTMQDLRRGTVWLKHYQLCSHCQLIQPLFTPQIWSLSLLVIISLSLPLFISLCDSEVWESTYLPLKGGKLHSLVGKYRPRCYQNQISFITLKNWGMRHL